MRQSGEGHGAGSAESAETSAGTPARQSRGAGLAGTPAQAAPEARLAGGRVASPGKQRPWAHLLRAGEGVPVASTASKTSETKGAAPPVCTGK